MKDVSDCAMTDVKLSLLCLNVKIKPMFLLRSHGQDHQDHNYLTMPNHAGHAHTYSGPPPSMAVLSAHAHMGMEQDYRAGSMAYRSGTLGRPHQAPPPPPLTETMNGSMPLPPVDYRFVLYYLINFFMLHTAVLV